MGEIGVVSAVALAVVSIGLYSSPAAAQQGLGGTIRLSWTVTLQDVVPRTQVRRQRDSLTITITSSGVREMEVQGGAGERTSFTFGEVTPLQRNPHSGARSIVWSIVSPNTIRRRFQNDFATTVITIRVDGSRCTANVVDALRPGRTRWVSRDNANGARIESTLRRSSNVSCRILR